MKRFDFFVGGILGVIGLGIVTFIFLTIYHWNSLSMNIENWEAASIFVPSLVTVVGWIIAMKIAMNQLEKSHENNRKIQHEIFENNEKLLVMNSAVTCLKEKAILAKNLSAAAYSLKLLMQELPNNRKIEQNLINARLLETALMDKWIELKINNEHLLFFKVKIDIKKMEILMVKNYYTPQCIWSCFQEAVTYHIVESEDVSDKIIFWCDELSRGAEIIYKECINLIREIAEKKLHFETNNPINPTQ